MNSPRHRECLHSFQQTCHAPGLQCDHLFRAAARFDKATNAVIAADASAAADESMRLKQDSEARGDWPVRNFRRDGGLIQYTS